MKCVIVLAILLLSNSLASATGDKETDVSQLRALTEKQRFIPTTMTRYSAVPRESEKIDEVVPLIGEVVAGRHKIGLSRDDGGCFAYPLVEPIVRHTDLHVIPYEIAYEKETTVHVPLQVTLKGATIGFDRGTKFYVRSPMVFDFEFHKNPRYLISIIQYYTDEEDIVAKAEDLLLVHEVIVSDIVKQADFRFEIMLHSHGSGGFAHSDYEHLGLILAQV